MVNGGIMFKRFFQRKAINELVKSTQNSGELVRTLNAFQLVMFGIGAIVGAGIFVLAGEAASNYAGPAVTISFAVSGLACVCAALCYAELASAIPVSGSAYTYIYATLGELAAAIMAGFMMLGSFLSVASVASGWSGYMQSLLATINIHIPAVFAATTGTVLTLADGSQATAIINMPALCIVLFVTFILYKGVQTSAIINTIIVILKMSVLFGFITIGLFYIDIGNWSPFIPENQGVFGQYGFSGVFAGAAMVFFSYNGFDAVATAAQETKNPQRDLPIGILCSLLVATFTYIMVAAVLTGIIKYDRLGVAQPIAIAADVIGMPWFAVLVKIGAVAGLTSVVLVMLYGLIRIVFVIAKDGLLPQVLTKIHPKYRTPYIATLVIGIVAAVIGSTVTLDKLVPLANFGIIGTFAIVCFSAIFLRYSQPKINRVFKCPMMPFIPLLGMVTLVGIMFSLPAATYIHAAIWLSIVVGFYLIYGQFHSTLNTKKND